MQKLDSFFLLTYTRPSFIPVHFKKCIKKRKRNNNKKTLVSLACFSTSDSWTIASLFGTAWRWFFVAFRSFWVTAWEFFTVRADLFVLIFVFEFIATNFVALRKKTRNMVSTAGNSNLQIILTSPVLSSCFLLSEKLDRCVCLGGNSRSMTQTKSKPKIAPNKIVATANRAYEPQAGSPYSFNSILFNSWE
jgi:hypothetical protein